MLNRWKIYILLGGSKYFGKKLSSIRAIRNWFGSFNKGGQNEHHLSKDLKEVTELVM